MASFTDRIQTFNPFISQIPVDAYNRAEMYKQGQYNQGVQSTQSYIDGVTGLDVDPKYQGYLDNSVASLQDQVKKVSGGDFSNMQLVTQIGGAASKIANDDIIKAGIMSSANLKSQQTIRTKAQADGKSSVENDSFLDDQYSKWRQNPDLSTPFTGKYVPYTDLNKKYLDVIKGLHADERLNDIPFETYQNPDGSISTGKISDVMMKLGISGISASKIENAIRATMTPTDMQQMAISGQYQFKNASPVDLMNAAQGRYKNNMQSMQASLDAANKELPTTTGNPQRNAQLKGIIDDYTSKLDPTKGALAMNYQNEIEAIKANPDNAKAQLYKNGMVSELANAFSWKKDSTEYVDSPFTKVSEWNKTYGVSVHNSQRADDKFAWDKSQDLIKNDFEYKKIMQKNEELYGKAGGVSTDLGVTTNVPSATTAMIKSASDMQSQATDYRQGLKQSLGNKNMPDGELDKMLDAYQKGDKNQFTPSQMQAADQSIKLTNDAKQVQGVIDNTRKEAEQEIYKTNPTMEDLLKGKPTLNVNSNGQRISFSPKEIADYLSKENYHSAGSTGVGGGAPGYTSVDQSTLSNKEKVLYNLVKSTYGQNPSDIHDGVVAGVINSIKPALISNSLNESKVNALLDNKLVSKNASWIPKVEEILTPTEAAKSSMESKAALFANDRMGNDNGSNAGANISDLNDWLKDPKVRSTLKYRYMTQGDNQQLWVENGDKKSMLTLTPSEASQLPITNRGVPEIQNMQRKLDLGDGNTNTTGQPEDGAYRQTDFKNVSKLNLTADLQRETKGNTVYVNVHIKTPTGWKTVQLNQGLDINGANEYIKRATDANILKDAINALNQRGQTSIVQELQNLPK